MASYTLSNVVGLAKGLELEMKLGREASKQPVRNGFRKSIITEKAVRRNRWRSGWVVNEISS